MLELLSKLRCIGCCLTLTLLCGNPLWADDTEIFFGTVSDKNMQPNVLFVLDGSGSMNWYDCANGRVSSRSCNDGTPNGTTTRLARLKSSLTHVLQNTSNVNVGLMRFSHSQSGGRILYPIRPIDQQFCNGEPCGEDTIFTAQTRTGASTDDAVESYTGEIQLDQHSIRLMEDPASGEQNAWIGLRFPDLQIPQGATITDARVQFTSPIDDSSATQLVFHSEDSTDAEPYSNQNYSVSGRDRSYTSVSWNGIEPWEFEGVYESPDLSSLVQLVVDKPGWCGGNALGIAVKGSGQRLIDAFDAGANNSPSITVSYKLKDIPPTGGCTKATVLSRVASNSDDASQDTRHRRFNGRVHRWSHVNYVAEPTNSRLRGFMAGMRFTDINVPKRSRILDATLTLTYRNTGWYRPTTRPGINIFAENSAAPPTMSGARYNISRRGLTSSVNWPASMINSAHDSVSTSTSIASLVQGIVNKGDWVSGNPISFVLKPAGRGGYTFYSVDGNSPKAPLLKIEYQTQIRTAADKISGPVTDVRSEIIEEMDSIVAYHGTPTVGALLEARNYFSGGKVDYGKTRSRYNGTWYANRYYWGRYSRVSSPESYTGGTVHRDRRCLDTNLDSHHCTNEYISGSPYYISPFTHECQSNHIVLLTDGAPTGDNDAVSKVKQITGGTCEGSPWGGGVCGEEIAQFMAENDQHDFAGDQFITTHTIGFNFATDWLEDVATAGGGNFYTADSAGQLSAAFANIIEGAQSEATTFVAPGATVDHFSKISHRNDIYLALFQPKSGPRWVGNLKRYDFGGSPARLLDANENDAIDTESGQFKEDAQSYWSENPDGNSVPSGGAASLLTPAARNLYTYNGTTDSLTHAENEFDSANDLIEADDLGLSPDDATGRHNVLEWARGYDVNDDDSDSETDDSRFFMGDPLHSKPVIVTYGGTSSNPDSLIFFGTNEGFLHAIDTSTGEEEFAFIPKELLPNLKPQFDNIPGAEKVYGLDGSLSLWNNDKNNNGVVNDDDHVYLYGGMRRGGYSYYALDVTDKDEPEFKWQITGGLGGTTGFAELGETWSQMVPATIRYGGTSKKVLIFGGGYDSSQDDKSTRTPDTMGRALYIVDAEDGDLLWSAGPPDGDETVQFDDMVYSMPATPKTIDMDGDGAIEQIYIGDMGGRVWRFDIDVESDSLDITGGVIADLGNDGVMADARRFYHTPDISLSRRNGELFVNVAIGSGYQAHPLNTAIDDRFYLIRYPYAFAGDDKYGIPEGNTSATGQPMPSDSYRPITESDLYDVTDNLIGEGTGEQIKAAKQQLANAEGWLLKMETSGEKILGSSVTFNNSVMFVSYIPDGTSIGCSPQIGSSRFWAVALWDAQPVHDLDEDNNGNNKEKLTKADRNKPIPGGGIAPPVQTLILQTEENPNETQIVTFSGGNSLLTHDFDSLIERKYWSEYPNF